MNKRIKSKQMKNILINNLNVKHYAEQKFIDKCDTCKEKEERSGWSCRNECDPEYGILYLFKCQDLIKLIQEVSGFDFNTYEFDENVNISKLVSNLKYYLIDNNINGFSFLFHEGKWGENNDYLQVVKYKRIIRGKLLR